VDVGEKGFKDLSRFKSPSGLCLMPQFFFTVNMYCSVLLHSVKSSAVCQRFNSGLD
jgi:hypothetical protein